MKESFPQNMNAAVGTIETAEQLRKEKISSIEGVSSFKDSVLTFLPNITHFPLEILEFGTEVKQINLNNSDLESLPEDFYKMTTLQTIFMGGSKKLVEVPDLSKNTNLEIIGLQNCAISSFPEDRIPLGCTWLMLTNNRLTDIPISIGTLTSLKKLALAGNNITEIPESLALCTEIELLRVSANSLINLPECILSMPKLAYFTDSGNQYNKERYGFKYTGSIIDSNDLEVNEEDPIAKSPSATIYKGVILSENTSIAVKRYVHNGMTSDGYTEDEREAFFCVSDNDNIVPISGVVIHQGEINLVMPFLHGYEKLGNPPTLTTITRDTFGGENLTRIHTIAELQTILLQVANALAHMHDLGVSHGDLYAHNILANESLDVKVSDFGAASFYEHDSEFLREKIDVRAFAYFVEDLLIDLKSRDGAIKVPDYLQHVLDCMLSTEVTARPRFSEILQLLHTDTVSD